MTTRKAPTICSMGRCCLEGKACRRPVLFPRPNRPRYCRPSCHAQPRAAGKRGFPNLSCRRAEAAGFRACQAMPGRGREFV